MGEEFSRRRGRRGTRAKRGDAEYAEKKPIGRSAFPADRYGAVGGYAALTGRDGVAYDFAGAMAPRVD